jgi:ribulose-phosphate 3-epimerase
VAAAAAGAAVITVHAEATSHLHRTMQEMTELSAAGGGFLRGVAVNPGTPVGAVEPVLGLADLVLVLAVSPGWPGQAPAAGTAGRIRAVRELARQAGADVLVGVDGGVTVGNAAEVAGWGADVVVAGSAIFDRADPAGNLERLTRELHRPSGRAS